MDKVNFISDISSQVLQKFIPVIIIIILVNLICKYIVAKMEFKVWIDWWNNNNGKLYNNSFDIISMACFNHSSLLFKIRQLFVPESAKLNETDILLLQSIIFTNAIQYKEVIPDSHNFLKPRQVCESILWGNEDIDIFIGAINSLYSKGDDIPEWYPKWVERGKPGPYDSVWADIIYDSYSDLQPDHKLSISGFWPNLNGCIGFFQINNISQTTSTPYDLTENYPDINKHKYIPGNGKFGSWAQLFADFGVVYTQILTISSQTKQTTVPVVKDFDPTYWYTNTGYIPPTTAPPDGIYGLNIFGLYGMNPASYAFTSWVGSQFNDPTTGIVFDPQLIPNLLGVGSGGSHFAKGGWIRFLKGLNTNLHSYDEIMNDLFSTYVTNYTTIPPDRLENKCPGGKTSAVVNAISIFFSIAGIALMFVPGGQGAGVAAEAAAAAAIRARYVQAGVVAAAVGTAAASYVGSGC